jgi:hypothetical protein
MIKTAEQERVENRRMENNGTKMDSKRMGEV